MSDSIADGGGELLGRLDLMLAILSLAHHDSIEKAGEELRRDDVVAAVLDAARDEWIGAGALQRAVSSMTRAPKRTISRRIAMLVGRRFLAKRGRAGATEYRALGVI